MKTGGPRFCLASYQATFIDSSNQKIERLIENITNNRIAPEDQRKALDLLAKLNTAHATARDDDPRLQSRIESFELAYRMQSEAAEAFDVSREPQNILDAYAPVIKLGSY